MGMIPCLGVPGRPISVPAAFSRAWEALHLLAGRGLGRALGVVLYGKRPCVVTLLVQCWLNASV